MGFASNGDLAHFHGFESGGLYLGRGAVDLVGQHEVVEIGAGLKLEVAYATNGKARGVPLNEVLTEALRTTKINELTGLVCSNRRQITGFYKEPRDDH